jgi:hypothetical protein
LRDPTSLAEVYGFLTLAVQATPGRKRAGWRSSYLLSLPSLNSK